MKISLLSLLVSTSGLIVTIYNQLSPVALNNKLTALEDIIRRIPKIASDSDDSSDSRLKIYAKRYQDLLNRAQWAAGPGWLWRPFFIVGFSLLQLTVVIRVFQIVLSSHYTDGDKVCYILKGIIAIILAAVLVVLVSRAFETKYSLLLPSDDAVLNYLQSTLVPEAPVKGSPQNVQKVYSGTEDKEHPTSSTRSPS